MANLICPLRGQLPVQISCRCTYITGREVRGIRYKSVGLRSRRQIQKRISTRMGEYSCNYQIRIAQQVPYSLASKHSICKATSLKKRALSSTYSIFIKDIVELTLRNT